MNQLNNWTEADHYSVFLGVLMDELIVKFKNLSPFSKEKSLFSSRVQAWEGLWIYSVFAIAARDEGESGYGHWSINTLYTYKGIHKCFPVSSSFCFLKFGE